MKKDNTYLEKENIYTLISVLIKEHNFNLPQTKIDNYEINMDSLINELKKQSSLMGPNTSIEVNDIVDNIFKLNKSLNKKNIRRSPLIKTSLIKKEDDNILNNIDKYYKEYIEHRKTFDKVSISSIKSYNSSFNYLKYFIDKNTTFNFKFFKDIQKDFKLLPKNFFKYSKYYKKTFKELLEIKEIEDYETLNNKTINNHINNYKMFFNYLKYEEYIESNPLSDIQTLPEDKEIKKEEYTNSDLNLIFKSDMDIDYINMCKVSLYTGLRIEEVLSIKKENIKNNLIHIDLDDTSSKKHQRIIPIHKNIQSILKFQTNNNTGDYIFFNGNISKEEINNVGKRTNRRIRNIIRDKNKSFHSFRKNFSQEIELNTAAEDRTKKYLMGHSQSKDITHTVYNRGKVNIEKLKDCINQITFEY